MAIHIVRQGECLSSIASHYGFHDWRTIYDHPKNADFKARRPDPNLIYPGDELYIPVRDPGAADRATDQKHVFVARFPPTFLNLCVQDLREKPIAGAQYKVIVGPVEIVGTTDKDGWIREKISARAERGTLLIWPNDATPNDFLAWTVMLGHLDPLDTTTGVKARLNNLGYFCGDINEEQNDLYDAAVRQFQDNHSLVVDGIVGPKTRAKLKEKHRV